MNALFEFLRELVHAPWCDFARGIALLGLIAIIAACAATMMA